MSIFTDKFGRGKVTGLAEQVHKSVKPTDVKHVRNILGMTGRGGMTHEMSYKLAKSQPAVAKLIVSRKNGKTVKK